MTAPNVQRRDKTLEVSFDDNRLLPLLYGEHGVNLARLEHLLGIKLATRGNEIRLRGPAELTERASMVLRALWHRLQEGLPVGPADIDSAVRVAEDHQTAQEGGAALDRFHLPESSLRTRKRRIAPRTPTQVAYLDAMRASELTFGLGPAGTGKSYLAVAQAVSMLLDAEIDRVILSRPAVEAGERLGFLPGDLKEKVDPYLRPLYDALYDMLPGDQVSRYIDTGTIEIAPLAFMRGRTLSNAFIILDEAQNTTAMQMRMFLTRMGENSRMVVTGDISQIDLRPGEKSGLKDALEILNGVQGISFIHFTSKDVMRHPLVTRIVRAYDAFDQGVLPLGLRGS